MWVPLGEFVALSAKCGIRAKKAHWSTSERDRDHRPHWCVFARWHMQKRLSFLLETWGMPPGYIFVRESREVCEAASMPYMAALQENIPNYTDVEQVVLISEIAIDHRRIGTGKRNNPNGS